MRLNVRLNDKEDRDIIQALSNAKNVSLEVRRLLRSGLNNTSLQTDANASNPVPVSQAPIHIPSKPLPAESEDNILNNILQGFMD